MLFLPATFIPTLLLIPSAPGLTKAAIRLGPCRFPFACAQGSSRILALGRGNSKFEAFF